MPTITYSSGLAWPTPYSHKRLFPGVNQDMPAQMVVSDEGLATALIVANKWPLAERKGGEKKVFTLKKKMISVGGGGHVCTAAYTWRSEGIFPE